MRHVPSFLIVSSLVGSAFADVLTVGASGADFTQIQPAVDQAAPGDVIVVRASAQPYAGFTVDGKGIAIVGEQSFQTLSGSMRIRNVPAGQTFVLRDIGTDAVDTQPLEVSGCEGPVRIERSYAGLFLAGSRPDFEAAIRVSDCEDVAADRLDAYMVDSISSQFTVPGMRVERSRFVGFEGFFQGGRGPAGNSLGAVPVDGGTGSPALEGIDSALFLHQIEMHGGAGGFGLSACNLPSIFPTDGGDGGFGFALASGSALLQSASLNGGYAGQGGHAVGACAAAANGAPGGALSDPSGVATFVPGPVRILHTSERVVREGAMLHISINARANEVVFLGLARRTGIGFTPSLAGEPLVISPILRRLVGTSGPDGITASIPIGELGPGVEGRVLYLQAVVFDAGGQGRWTNLSCVAVLDAAL